MQINAPLVKLSTRMSVSQPASLLEASRMEDYFSKDLGTTGQVDASLKNSETS